MECKLLIYHFILRYYNINAKVFIIVFNDFAKMRFIINIERTC